jgi:uncharacterized membrane protein
MKREEALIRWIEEQAWIDDVADPVQNAVREVLHRAPRLGAFLHGEWLGHPLHPALVALPVGAFTTAMVLDTMELFGKGRRYRRAADTTLRIGLVGAGLAILPGLADWSHTTEGAKRVGFVHASLNAIVAGLYGASILARSRRKRGLGIGLSMAGFALLGASAWLGGELVFRFGVRVQTEGEPVGTARTGAAARP